MIAVYVIVALAIVYLGLSCYVVIKRVPIDRLPVQGTPADVGLGYEDIEFFSRADNALLKGWLIPGDGDHVVIVVNGLDQPRIDSDVGTLQLSKDLHDEGFTILLFDLRGRGESEGKGVFLTHDDRDLGGAVDYMESQGYKRVSLLAFSAGAASSLSFASQEELATVVSDNSFASLKELLVREGVKDTRLPELVVKLFIPGIFLMVKVLYGYAGIEPIDVVADISCPVMFIHGEADEDIPAADAYELYRSKNDSRDELWIVPGAGHTQSYKADPVEYVSRITEFLRRQS